MRRLGLQTVNRGSGLTRATSLYRGRQWSSQETNGSFGDQVHVGLEDLGQHSHEEQGDLGRRRQTLSKPLRPEPVFH